MKDFIITVDHINPKKRKAMICKILTHMKKLGYTTVDRYVEDTDDPERIGYITTKGVHDKGWGMCMEYYGLCSKGTCHDCSCGWDKVAAEDFLKFIASDIEEPKKISCKIDLSWLRAEAREVISEAIQKKLFEAGVKWRAGEMVPIETASSYIYVVSNEITHTDNKDTFDGVIDGLHYTKEQLSNIPEVSVNNALKGNFWTYSTPHKKEEPKPEGYRVSLASYTGKAREAISKAIQEEAFKKRFSWHGDQKINCPNEPYLFFSVSNKYIGWDNLCSYYDAHKYKELSVEEILSGALPKVN